VPSSRTSKPLGLRWRAASGTSRRRVRSLLRRRTGRGLVRVADFDGEGGGFFAADVGGIGNYEIECE